MFASLSTLQQAKNEPDNDLILHLWTTFRKKIFDICLLKMEHETKATLKLINDDIKGHKSSAFNQKLMDSSAQLLFENPTILHNIKKIYPNHKLNTSCSFIVS